MIEPIGLDDAPESGRGRRMTLGEMNSIPRDAVCLGPNASRFPHTNGPNLWGPDHWHPRAYKTQTLRARRRQMGSHFPYAL
jgi:hypothetical protein